MASNEKMYENWRRILIKWWIKKPSQPYLGLAAHSQMKHKNLQNISILNKRDRIAQIKTNLFKAFQVTQKNCGGKIEWTVRNCFNQETSIIVSSHLRLFH